MKNNYVLYWSMWCPLEEVRENIRNGQQMFRYMIDHLKDYNEECGIVFIELTEESLKCLPVMMVDNMKCFSKDNIDTMVFHTKEIKCNESKTPGLKQIFEECLAELSSCGFSSELLIMKEIKYEEENIGKTVGKKKYEIWHHNSFA